MAEQHGPTIDARCEIARRNETDFLHFLGDNCVDVWNLDYHQDIWLWYSATHLWISVYSQCSARLQHSKYRRPKINMCAATQLKKCVHMWLNILSHRSLPLCYEFYERGIPKRPLVGCDKRNVSWIFNAAISSGNRSQLSHRNCWLMHRASSAWYNFISFSFHSVSGSLE